MTGTDTNVVVALWRFGIRIASDLAYLFTCEGEATDFLELVVPEFSPEAMSSDEAKALHTAFLGVWYRAREASEPEIEHKATALRKHMKSGDTAQASAQEEVRRPATSLGEPGSSTVLTAAPRFTSCWRNVMKQIQATWIGQKVFRRFHVTRKPRRLVGWGRR